MKTSDRSVMIVAAEASSAKYAESLILEWKKRKEAIHFFGVGTIQMEKLGFERIGKAEEMAVVGLVEVIQHYSELKKIFYNLLEQVKKNKPSFVVLMDYPDFNLRLAREIKKMNIPVFYYISPQVWAWRQSRIHDIKAYCKKVFLLFPFEKAFYDKHQVPNQFVGHPLIEELDESLFDQQKIQAHRSKYGLSPKEKVLALMPGSRKGEIERMFLTQLQTAQILLKKHADLRVIILVAPTLKKENLEVYLDQISFPYILIQDDPARMISLADFVLVASGTATLLVGLLHKPMVIMYKVNWLTGKIGSFLTRHLKYFGLVNLISNESVVPEVKQEDVEPYKLATLVESYINDPAKTVLTIERLKKLKSKLGHEDHDPKNTTQKVVDALSEYF
jgi:lipid-A-disaccharide synthase